MGVDSSSPAACYDAASQQGEQAAVQHHRLSLAPGEPGQQQDQQQDPFALTHSNLRLLDGANSRTTSDARRSTLGYIPAKSPEGRLRCYGIELPYQTDSKLHPLLRKFVDTILTRPRQRAVSPNARTVVDRQSRAAKKSKQDGIDLLLRPLLFPPAYDDNGEPFVDVCAKPKLDCNYIPDRLSQNPVDFDCPEPDTCIGYITRDIALSCTPWVQPPFSEQEEFVIYHMTVHGDVFYPFLTCQWESSLDGGTHEAAQIHGARDAAVLINSLYQIFRIANPGEPSHPRDTCHFSVTCDMLSAMLYVHWREEDHAGTPAYRSCVLLECNLKDLRAVQDFRRILRNILDDAMGDRLAVFRALIPILENACYGRTSVASSSRLAVKSSTPTQLSPLPIAASINSQSDINPDFPVPTTEHVPSSADDEGRERSTRGPRKRKANDDDNDNRDVVNYWYT
ncbi:hypothetical protein K505DRAFT_326231 [Melanomma pulvis-pyrius CBS 109.77]|uniref:DUF7924 domain-containing protein n=1 Tax=Melanomma pulvis-pyrius CBS 109.77 TaxID=1314802 RepID=A0A6A6X915_9PLEO|nr:hypothetical protein K505DRAFT_326231 [Melanomma pulvis-pyrius CBS 109.77]